MINGFIFVNASWLFIGICRISASGIAGVSVATACTRCAATRSLSKGIFRD